MKSVVYHRTFKKHLKLRITPHQKLLSQFEERFALFMKGGQDTLLKDHSLTGKLVGKRAFSITADIRVLYEEQDDVIVVLDIGTHNQVYK